MVQNEVEKMNKENVEKKKKRKEEKIEEKMKKGKITNKQRNREELTDTQLTIKNKQQNEIFVYMMLTLISQNSNLKF